MHGATPPPRPHQRFLSLPLNQTPKIEISLSRVRRALCAFHTSQSALSLYKITTMDPFTAIGLASNVFSFVSFASGLIRGTIEIHSSAVGCSVNVSQLDEIYEQLQSLFNALESCAKHDIVKLDDYDPVVEKLQAIIRLSQICKSDGQELLRIIKRLRTKGGSKGKWDSFRVALRTARQKSTIDELDNRFSKNQVALTLHICTLAQRVQLIKTGLRSATSENLYSYCSEAQSKQLRLLKYRSEKLQSNQEQFFDQMSHEIGDIKEWIKEVQNLVHTGSQKSFDTANDVESLQRKLQSLSLSQTEVTKQQSVLESLDFESKPVRHAQIPQAHQETFKWALDTVRDENQSQGIGNWLRNGERIFWVSGKPGSGKSTFMKFAADSEDARRFLQEWAQPRQAIIASHYFWISGTPMQKSQQGLLQTLLYDIFRQCPDLIHSACPTRWARSDSTGPWSMGELCMVLHAVANEKTGRVRFCFFIDGLDEFNGGYEDRIQMCGAFNDLAASENIKICLSSRPWNIFEEQFGLECPKLYIHHWTRGDIQRYTISRLREHPRWDAVLANHSQGDELISEIVAKSSGVFLWVFLVTKLLREGLTNRDNFSDLHRRLRSFPSELGPFFKAILESVEPFYHSHMSTALQIAVTAGERRLNFLAYSFHFQEYEDTSYAINLPIRAMSSQEVQDIETDISWQLDSRTHGLLEVNSEDGTVMFLHRTARDFFNTPEIHRFLVSKVDKHLEFLPSLSILRALVAIMKSLSFPIRIKRTSFGKYDTAGHDSRSKVLDLVPEALNYAEDLEVQPVVDLRHRGLLDELDRSLPYVLSGKRCS